MAALIKTPAEVIAIDGKTSRRSYQKKGAKEPIHMVSAFAARLRLVPRAPGKDSLRLRRKTAARDDDYLASLAAA